MIFIIHAKKKLPPDYRRFVHEYIRNGYNGTRAVIDTWGTTNYNWARVKASEILTKPNVMEAINSALPSLDECSKELTRLRSLSEEKGDMASAIRTVEDQVRMQAGFKDKLETEQKITISKDEQADLIKLRTDLLADAKN